MDTDVTTLDHVPVTALDIHFAAFFTGVVYLGHRRGRKQRGATGETESSGAFVQTTVFALIVFFPAFTFSIAGALYDERRAPLIDDAVPISTANAETDLLGPTEAQGSRALYLDRIARVIALVRTVGATGNSLREAEALLDALWEVSAAYVNANPNPVTFRYANGLIAVGDLHKQWIDRAPWMNVPDLLILQLVRLTAFAIYNVGRSGALTIKGSGLRSEWYSSGLFFDREPQSTVRRPPWFQPRTHSWGFEGDQYRPWRSTSARLTRVGSALMLPIRRSSMHEQK